MNILHLIFRPSLTAAQSQNPRRSPATPAVLFNRYSQIRPKSERNFVQLIIASLLSKNCVVIEAFKGPGMKKMRSNQNQL
jgi:hypothetical protein